MKKFKNMKLMLLGLLAMGSVNAWSAPRYEAADSLVYQITDDGVVTFYGIAEAAIKDFSGNIVIPDKVNLHSTVGTLQEFIVSGLGRNDWTAAHTDSKSGKLEDAKIKSITIKCRLDAGVASGKEGYGWEGLTNSGALWESWTNFEKLVVEDAHNVATVAALKAPKVKYIDLSGVSNDARGITFADNYAKNNKNLTTMIFPTSTTDVITIGASAFEGANNLSVVTLGGKEVKIGNKAFWGVLGGEKVAGDGKWLGATISPVDNIVSIGDEAFENAKFKSITIGKKVKTIGTDAFKMEWIAVHDQSGIYFNSEVMEEVPAVFGGQNEITSIVINSPTVTSIAKGAFAECAAVKTIDFSKATALKTIPAGTITSTVLETVNLEGTQLESLAGMTDPTASKATLKTFKFPTTLKGTLPSFAECKLLETLNAIPAGITDITSFKNCQKLTAIDLSATGVKKIPANAFEMDEADKGTAGTTQIMVKGIGQWKTALAEVKLNAETTTIGASAFKGCSKLAKVNLAELTKLTKIDANAFQYTIIPEVDLTGATAKDTEGKYQFTKIANYAFADNTALTTVKLAPGIKEIGDYAFAFFGSKVSGTQPKSATSTTIDFAKLTTKGVLATVEGLNSAEITSIGEGAFYGAAIPALDLSATKIPNVPTLAFAYNSNLAEVKLPAQISTIDAQAFLYNVKLASINLNQTDIQVLNNLFTYDGDPDVEVSLDALEGVKLVKDASIKISDKPLNDLTTIAEYAFQFTGLKNIIIPETVTKFGVDTKGTKADDSKGASDGFNDNGRVFQGCLNLKIFEWKNVDATIYTLPVGTFKGDIKLEKVTFLALASTSSLQAIKDKEVFFMCDKALLHVVLTPDHYNVTKAAGYDNDNRTYSTLDVEGNKQFAFTEKNKASDGYYYATYFNLVNASWFDATKFDVFSAVVEGNKVVLKPATAAADGYYKVGILKKSSSGFYDNAAKTVCVVRSKNIDAIPELKSNEGSAELSTLADNQLKVSNGSAKGSKLNYIFKLANVGGNVAFYRVTSGTFADKKVYIEANPAAARLDIFVEGEGAITGIENLFAAEETVDDAPVYNLQGARVNGNLQKGIYVKNGKKFIVK